MKITANQAKILTTKHDRFNMYIDSIYDSIKESAKCGLTFSKHYYSKSLDQDILNELLNKGFRVKENKTDSIIEYTIYW